MLRLAVAASCLMAASLASAQVSQMLDGAFQTFHYYGLFPGPPSKNPLDMSGFGPKLPEQFPMTGSIPSTDLVIDFGGQTTHPGDQPGVVHAEGGFQAEYKGYRMQGDVLDGNRNSEVYVISGNAVLTGPDAVIHARRILVDYANRTYEAFGGESELRPAVVGGILQTDIYSKFRHSNGSELEQFLHLGEVTTCNYPEPHYALDARDIDLRFNKRIIFRELSVWVLGHHLFNLPYLAIPLDDRRYQNLPQVGQDSYEGYFIKTHYGIPLKGDEVLYTRLDYMTKLGVGAGFDYTVKHSSPSSSYVSELSVYGVSNIQMLDIQQQHDQTFKWGKLQIQNTYNGHDYLTAPDNDILSSRVNLQVNNRQGQTTLSYNRNSNTAPGFDSLQQSFSVSNSETLGDRFRETSQVTYNDSANSFSNGSTTSTIDHKEIDVNVDAQEDARRFLAIFDYQRDIPVGQTQGTFIGTTDRTPNLSLQSDTGRLFGSGVGRAFPFKADVELGQFGDPQSGASITRDRIDLEFAKQGDSTKRWHFDTEARFIQSLYSDNTAQYVVGTNETFTYRFGRDTAFNLRYSYLRPEGYTPLGIDQVGQSNLVSDDISVRPVKSLLLGVQSSYDFIQRQQGSIGYSPVGIRAEYQPHDWLLLRTLATYDPFFKGVANYRLDATYQPGATVIGLGARYDNTRSTWAEIDLYISSLKWGRLKSDVRLSYNGYSNQFNSIQTSFVYDLHCAEAVLQIVDNPVGFQSGTSFLFFIRLKGVPFDTSFGSGTRGQPIGYGTGVGY